MAFNASTAATETANVASDLAAYETSNDAALATETGRIDAILAASDADKDSFAEIVTLINTVDTENDDAFAAYVLSNNAAVAAVQADVDQNESDADAAIAALQADVNQNEADADAAFDSAKVDRAAVRSEFAAADLAANAAATADRAAIRSEFAAADAELDGKITDIISNTDVTALDSFSEVSNHLDRLEDNHLQSISVNTVANGNGDLIGLYSQACLTGFKQGTVQVFLNGQLLTEGVDWQEAVAYTDLDSLPGEGVAVGAVKLLYTGNVSDSHVIYAVKHSDEIAYGSGSGSSEQRSSTAPAPDSGSADTGSADTGSLSKTPASTDSGSEEEVGYGYGYNNISNPYSHLSVEELNWMDMDTGMTLFNTIFDVIVNRVNSANGLANAVTNVWFAYEVMQFVNEGLRLGYDWDTFHDLLAEALGDEFTGTGAQLVTYLQTYFTDTNVFSTMIINDFGSQYAENTFTTNWLNVQFDGSNFFLAMTNNMNSNVDISAYNAAVAAAESTYVDLSTSFTPA